MININCFRTDIFGSLGNFVAAKAVERRNVDVQTDAVENMLQRYFEEQIIDINSNPLKYWETKKISMEPMAKV